jgi:transcriptional regulator with XRE-family HTH domain
MCNIINISTILLIYEIDCIIFSFNLARPGVLGMTELQDLDVGRRIRSLRKGRGLSLLALAERCGLSPNAISKIERGENSPTVSSLRRLANGLDVSVIDLFKDEKTASTIFVKGDNRSQTRAAGATIESLGSGLPEQGLEPLWITIEPGSGSTNDTVSHPGEEFVLCLEGCVEYRVADRLYRLDPGDSLFFKADQPHCFHNPAENVAVFLLVLQEQEAEGRRLARQVHLEF